MDAPPLQLTDLPITQWAVVDLPMGVQCRWRVLPDGLEAPGTGDLVQAQARLALPWSGAGNDRLHHDLCFGERLTFGGEALTSKWGSVQPADGGRVGMHWCKAVTWRQALLEAAAFCLAEIDKLRQALAVREAALKSDGWEIAATHKAIAAQPAKFEATDDEVPF